MTEDGDETHPSGASRTTLAASTLRALRAGNRGVRPPSEPEVEDVSVEAMPVEAVPVEDVPVEDALVEDVPVEDTPVAAGPVPDTVPTEAVTQPAATGSRRSSLLTAACAVVAVAALVFAVIAGVVWWTSAHSAQHGLGVARQQVLDDAQLAIVTVNTSDYRHPSAALSNWLDASTGALHSQFGQSRTAAVKLLAEAKTVTRATVLDEAVTTIDLSKGTASVLASVNVTRDHNGSISTVRNRFRASMTRVGGQWKLSDLAVVAVSLS